jgi:uncharacterized protein (TIGR04255 family)
LLRETQTMRSLPTFKDPPINEVVLSIQFAALAKLKSAYVGLFWDKIRSKYPTVSEQPAIGPVFETFGGRRFQNPSFSIETLFSPPFPRYWFEKPGNGDLLQLQQDRILRNWRQDASNSRTYPRYPAIRQEFVDDLAFFENWLREEDLGSVLPNQCEVTYINLITLPDGTNPHEQLQRISNVWTGKLGSEIQHGIENTNVQMTCVFHHNEKPAGRIYVNFQSAVTVSDARPVMKLDITARGKPFGEDTAAAFEYLDIARHHVVNMFAALTTKEMHEIWGRSDA